MKPNTSQALAIASLAAMGAAMMSPGAESILPPPRSTRRRRLVCERYDNWPRTPEQFAADLERSRQLAAKRDAKRARIKRRRAEGNALGMTGKAYRKAVKRGNR